MKQDITFDDIYKHKFKIILSVIIISSILVIIFNNNENIDDNVNDDTYISEVRYEASRYNPTLDSYRTSDTVKAQMYIIEKNNNCGDLRKIFERNSDWWSLPMLADKIERTCI